MAIQKLTISSLTDIKNAIESLDWFDNVYIDSGNGALQCEINNKIYISFASLRQMAFYACGWESGDTGDIVAGSIVDLAAGFKTKNGLMLMSALTPASGGYYWGCCICTGDGTGSPAIIAWSSSNGQIYTGCTGETSAEMGTKPMQIATPYSIGGVGRWPTSPQVVMVPIPTHPDNYEEYIKNVYGIIVAPGQIVGGSIVEIDGIKYATNGNLLISDED